MPPKKGDDYFAEVREAARRQLQEFTERMRQLIQEEGENPAEEFERPREVWTEEQREEWWRSHRRPKR